MRRPREEDTTVWIAYADFLTTLAILFFIIAVTLAARTQRDPGFLYGEVVDGRDDPLGDCLVRSGFGAERATRTDDVGEFDFRFDGIWKAVDIGITVNCTGYEPVDTVDRVVPGDTTHLLLRLNADRRVGGDTMITIEPLLGDELFERNEAILLADAVSKLIAIGEQFRDELRPGDVIAVQGHTDDLPFPPGSGKDNWVLSGERAAVAARLFTDPRYGVRLLPCQIVTMGFGPSRPREEVQAEDLPEERRRKRAQNRRIEFRKLRGADLTGTGCEG